MERFDGELIARFEFDGDFQSSNSFDGQSSTYQIVKDIDAYQGAYEFIPSDSEQVVEIANLMALENIVINPIPSNYGKITWNGANLIVE